MWIWKATTLYMQCKPLFKKLNCLKVQYSLEILIGYSSSNFTLIEGQNMFFDVIISCLSSYSWLCIYWSFSLKYVLSCKSNLNQIYILFINNSEDCIKTSLMRRKHGNIIVIALCCNSFIASLIYAFSVSAFYALVPFIFLICLKLNIK